MWQHRVKMALQF